MTSRGQRYLLPLKDLNRSSTTPHVNRWLLALNIIIFVVFWLSSQNILFDQRLAQDIIGTETTTGKFIMVPSEIIQGQRLYTLVTSMFMHVGWFHLLGNMLFLYIFGDNIEDAFGHISYLLFYLVCGVAASLAQIFSTMFFSGDLTIPVVGASGAISGVLGAYLVLYPKVRIFALVGYFILPVPAIIFLGFWFILQWLYGLVDPLGGVAYFAHVGGFIFGMILAATVGQKRKKAREARLRL
jgi:membrane associated rhomboid family serine protease